MGTDRAPTADAPGTPGREDADWFRNLPAAAQEEYRARWAAEESRRTSRRTMRRFSVREGAVRGLLVFLVVDGLFGVGGWPQHVVAAVVGASVGALWVRLDAGWVAYVATGPAAWVALAAAFGPNRFGWFMVLVGMPMHAALSALAAQVRETKLSDREET